MKRILVAGIGNIFFGDDGFGVEVARALAKSALPEGVRVVDFGIRGFDLACAMLDGYDGVVMVDIVQRGGDPGTLYLIEPETGDLPECTFIETHGLEPVKMLALAREMGGELECLRLIGCEPQAFGEDSMGIGLSPPVAAAVGPAVELVQSVVAKLRDEVREGPAHA